MFEFHRAANFEISLTEEQLKEYDRNLQILKNDKQSFSLSEDKFYEFQENLINLNNLSIEFDRIKHEVYFQLCMIRTYKIKLYLNLS